MTFDTNYEFIILIGFRFFLFILIILLIFFIFFFFENKKVGADGANSMVRKQMNVNYFQMSYDQMGLIATVELAECDENFVAWQRFLSNGVIALLPLSDKLSSIVWSTDIKNFKYLMQLNDTDFIDAVNNAFVSICQCKYLI